MRKPNAAKLKMRLKRCSERKKLAIMLLERKGIKERQRESHGWGDHEREEFVTRQDAYEHSAAMQRMTSHQ